jgi:rod shape-determining protein MreD
MNGPRTSRLHLGIVFVTLVLLHFYVRPRLFDTRLAPDFLLFGLVVFAMRSGPGAGAVVGFLVGLTTDALSPARFGAATLADTMVGYAAAWGRAVFFADNVLVNAGFVAVGLWLRDLILLVASGTPPGQLLVELGVYSPLQAIITAAAGALVLLAFRQWFAVRLDG